MAKVWRIHVDVPHESGLTDDQHNALFTAIADTVHDWEPEHRNGWDTNIWSTTVEEPPLTCPNG